LSYPVDCCFYCELEKYWTEMKFELLLNLFLSDGSEWREVGVKVDAKMENGGKLIDFSGSSFLIH
jgi:hypothetical protein